MVHDKVYQVTTNPYYQDSQDDLGVESLQDIGLLPYIGLLPLPSPNKRYLHAYKVKEDTRLRLSPEGFCNWCGKRLTGRSKYFCPPSEWEICEGYTQKDYWCTRFFTAWWTSVPRFKRAIFIRDAFTCQNCGLKPITHNQHGVEIPDLSLLACDHIYPYSKGGKTELGNLQCLCKHCNSKKRDKIPSEFQESVGQMVMELNI